MDYEDLILRLGPALGEDRFAVSASSAREGEAHGVFSSPFDESQLERFFRQVGRPGRAVRGLGSEEWQAAQTFGQKLFSAVFADELQPLFAASRNASHHNGKGLRLKLVLNAPELANYPWEFLCEPALHRFLNLYEATPVVRYADLPSPVTPLRTALPLRVLVVTSSPRDFGPLDVAREKRNLSDALSDAQARGLVSLHWLDDATLEIIHEALLKDTYNIFHFIGHGGFDPDKNDGVLVLQDEAGCGDLVSAERLGILFGNHPTLRLVFLNSCEGARTSVQDPFAGAALTFLRSAGIPAVVAMQFEITDQASIAFSRGFYQALATGRPVDAAVAQARVAVLMSPNDLEWGTPVLYLRAPDGVIFQPPASDDLAHTPSAPLEIGSPARAAKPARVFISYRRHVGRDERLAQALSASLTRLGHTVFMDITMRTGAPWLEEIDRQIKTTDFLIVLLSKESADSEMVQAEVTRAYEYRKAQGHPQTLPVRVAYEGQLPYAISAFLNPLQYALWRDESDTARVGQEIQQAIEGQWPDRLQLGPPHASGDIVLSEDGRPVTDGKPVHPPLPEFDPRFLGELQAPGGTVKLSDRFYVEREADGHFRREIVKAGTTTTIRASRQTGKSSLLVRGVRHARANGAHVVSLDAQAVASEQLASLDVFLRYLADAIVRKLRLDPAPLDKLWQGSLGALDKLTYLMEDYILQESSSPVVLALDEADRLLDTRFYRDFFGLMRAWHNNRAADELWNKLNVVMAISTEPYLLIPDVTQSPFNVGLKLYLEDFDAAQVRDLNHRHGTPVSDAEFTSFMQLLNGHPYLTRKALYTLVTERMTWTDLEGTAASDQGPFGDHLRRQYWLLRDAPELRLALKNILTRAQCPEDMAFFRLLRAGLVSGSGAVCRCRCGLYEKYFKDKL